MTKHNNKKQSKFIKIINDNIDQIKDLFISNIPNNSIKPSSNRIKDKITIKCPYCNDNRTRFKLIINLDWANFKCFRCGESGSIIKLVKKFGFYNEFSSLLASLSNISNFNIQSLFKTDIIQTDEELDLNETTKKIKEFNKANFLVPINKIQSAKDYALERVFNNNEEIESYMVDDRYIYIPITIDDRLVAYMARRYIEIDSIPRYILRIFDDDVPLIGFIDEVSNNMSTNDLYITEGYFDAYAINHSMSNYVSICTFGKNKKTDIMNIAKYFPNNTNVYLTLDSIKKDPDIVYDNLSFGDTLLNYFNNVHVINLFDDDPADILKNRGSLYLKKILKENTIPFIKYKIMNSGRKIYA